ncbi:hypothetical protein P691DRAFT_781643 [Macrolepiota fuliginosa MF-IS2]|uniref:Uncharacterized protein n=1 Tax=Macrolepiota fuliginosa MF-IS2 TaxID=1400762 RepID=A0A9P6C1N8_9AGAR|nr:hypothetical protein P691DRAFT_781643 [Macrolepiota fuliginosa MF-IS2]
MSTNLDEMGVLLRMTLPATIVSAVGAFSTGACLTLATMSFTLLSSKTGGPPMQQHLLQSIDKNMADRLVLVTNAFSVVVIYIADGLLVRMVWRCYMVHKALVGHSSSFWGKISWVISPEQDILTAALLICNALMNIHGTAFITIRLLRHRHMVRTSFGDKVPVARYHSIVGIMLESAAINVPITICAAAGNLSTGSTPLTWVIVYSICTPGQAFAVLLVIHRVALGRAIGQHDRKEVALPMEKSEQLAAHSIPLHQRANVHDTLD